MSMNRYFYYIITILLIFFIGLTACQKEKSASGEKQNKVIYDVNADAEKDIELALVKAEKTGKKVLLMFGGNWCPWCHRLHALFETNEPVKEALESNYILVMVNVDQENKQEALNEKYGDPFQFGFPVLVVLDAAGIQLTTQETGSLENPPESEVKGHDPEKVLAFLEKWKN